MIKSNGKTPKTPRALAVLVTGVTLMALGLTWSCGSSDSGPAVEADIFTGGSLSNFSGNDGGDSDARAIARDMATSRNFEFTPTGFLVSGNVNSDGPVGSDFSVGSGLLEVDGDTVNVTLLLTSTNPDITNPQMEGSFSLSEAQNAIISPGASFPVDWTISFDALGSPFSLTATQELTGADFI
jgi:hypothetical protein